MGKLVTENRELEWAKVRLRVPTACDVDSSAGSMFCRCLILSHLACQERLQHQSETVAKQHTESRNSVEKKVRTRTQHFQD